MSTTFQTKVYGLDSIERRWSKLPQAEQGAIADKLAALERNDWCKMSLAEKRASYGNHGSRTASNPSNKYRVFAWTSFFVGISIVGWRYWVNNIVPKVRTQTPEWEAAQAEKDIELKRNPHRGAYKEYRDKQAKEQEGK